MEDRPVLRSRDTDRPTCARHGMPLARAGRRSWASLWCLPFCAASSSRGGHTYRPGDGTPVGRSLALANELSAATADHPSRTVTVFFDGRPAAVELPDTPEPEDLVLLEGADEPDAAPPHDILIRRLADTADHGDQP